MKHPSFDQLRSAGTERPGASESVRAHVAQCLVCRDTVEWCDQVRLGITAATALPAPALAWEAIAERVRARAIVVLPVEAEARTTDTQRRALRFAAAAALVISTVVAAGVPDSPLRRWLNETLSRPEASAPTVSPPTTPAAPSEVETVLIVEPVDNAVLLVLEQAAPGVRVRVRVSESGPVEVRATAAAAGAQFRSGNGRLTISNTTAGEVTLTIPRSLRRALIEVNGSVYLSKDRGQLRIFAPVADTVGSEIVLPVTQARPETGR